MPCMLGCGIGNSRTGIDRCHKWVLGEDRSLLGVCIILGLFAWRKLTGDLYLTENISILQLRIVRERGLFGDIAVHLVAKPNSLLHVNNQATENEDYVLQEAMVIIRENVTEAHAEVAILPVSLTLLSTMWYGRCFSWWSGDALMCKNDFPEDAVWPFKVCWSFAFTFKLG